MSALLLLLLGAASAAELPPAPDPAAVTSEDDARARELFENGAALYDEGRYEDAMAAWSEAWRLSGRPLLLYNMAGAAERLSRWEDAVDLLSRYRAFAPAEERETLERRISNIERRLEGAPADPHVGPARKLHLPVTLFAAGGAGIVTGSVFGVLALDARAQVASLCTSTGGEVRCPESAAGLLAAERTDALVADVAVGLGLVAIGGGLLAALLPNLPERGGVEVAVDLTPGGALVRVGGPLR